ncbi:SIS domain-containing protein, partial [bacterium]|nr:SIS domain-containing protein [bacterium]
MEFVKKYLIEAKEIVDQLDVNAIEKMAILIGETRERNGRMFVLGVGGSAANASHAVNDFRKIVGLE